MLLSKYKENECKCNICVNMCKTRPCWGTPEEIKKIIEAGFANKLMLDYWVSEPDIYIVSPAIKGYEKGNAPYTPRGVCIFLKNDLCKLHDLKLKPFEARVAGCKMEDDFNVHMDVAMEWDTDKGREVVKIWKKKVKLV